MGDGETSHSSLAICAADESREPHLSIISCSAITKAETLLTGKNAIGNFLALRVL